MSNYQPVAVPRNPVRQARCAIRLMPVLWWALVSGSVGAGESRIELRDGSVLSGDVVGVGDGGYRIRSATLGEIQVRESDVLAIRPGAAGGATSSTAGADAGGQSGSLAAIQQQLLGNPQTMDSIKRLQSDPGITAALADPAFARLILSGDLDALRADPRFQQLMENPEIRAIVGQALGR